MERADTVEAVRAQVRAWHDAGERVALVPTMGNLHAGHISLLAVAHNRADRVVASIFVNPLQFGPTEDYSQYPRTPDEDAELLQAGRCDLLFSPSVTELYPAHGTQPTLVTVRGLSTILCGEFRPGHFDGVATVVAKLLGIVRPDVAVFGKKDYQQFMVIRRMALDLAIPVEILGAPTVRSPDGLALSSRNRYLSVEERARAPAIHNALQAAVRRIDAGDRDFATIGRAGCQALEQVGMRPDYFEVRNADDLAVPDAETRELVVLTAAHLGRARLIDNLQVRSP